MHTAPGDDTTLVLGLGNPILGDDGVGWRVAEALEARIAREGRIDSPRGALPPRVEIDRLSVGGLRLMERLIGYRRAIIVDAVETGTAPPGTVRRVRLDELPVPGQERLASAHDSSLAAALALGRSLGAPLPESPWVVTVEAELGIEVGDRLTAAVEAAIPVATTAVLEVLAQDEARGDEGGTGSCTS